MNLLIRIKWLFVIAGYVCFSLGVDAASRRGAKEQNSAPSTPLDKVVGQARGGKVEAKTEVLFDGYYKVSMYGQHMGYLITRFEFDPAKKQMRHIYYQRLAKQGFDLTESLKAVSDEEFKPLSYEFTQLNGKNVKLIDAKIAKNKLTGNQVENGKSKKLTVDIPKGTFFSSFLYYVMLKNPTGMKPGTSFNFKAISEDNAEIQDGKSAIAGKMVTYGKNNAFKAVNEYAGSRYENYMTEKAEILAAYTPATGVSLDLTASIDEATGGIPVNSDVLKKLFGEVPAGTSNALMEGGLKQIKPSTPEQQIPAKTLPAKSNQGVIQKMGTAPTEVPANGDATNNREKKGETNE